jgi:hypothetical protein
MISTRSSINGWPNGEWIDPESVQWHEKNNSNGLRSRSDERCLGKAQRNCAGCRRLNSEATRLYDGNDDDKDSGRKGIYFSGSASQKTLSEISKRFFDGSVKSMVLSLLKTEQITVDDLAELRSAIDSLEKAR